MAKKEKVESIEIIESPEALQQEVSKVTDLVEKNKSGVATILGGLVIIIAAYFGYQWYTTTQDAEGEKKLFKAVYAFESDSAALAAKELAKVSLVNTLERVIKYLSFALITLGVVLLAFKTVMQRRLIKIAELLNRHPAGKVDQYIRKVNLK